MGVVKSLAQLKWSNGSMSMSREVLERGLELQVGSFQKAVILNAWGRLEADCGNFPRCAVAFGNWCRMLCLANIIQWFWRHIAG